MHVGVVQGHSKFSKTLLKKRLPIKIDRFARSVEDGRAMIEDPGVLEGFDDQFESDAVEVAATDTDHGFMGSHMEVVLKCKFNQIPGRFGLFLQRVHAEKITRTTFSAG